jgi:hypothetical protein
LRRLPVLIAIAVLGGCGSPPEREVDNAWVRLAAVKGRPAVAYFTVRGGPSDSTIIAVTSDVSIGAEMHESMKRGAAMTMAPLGRVRVPARGEVRFEPGGKHVMLYDMNPGIVRGGRAVLLTLTFEDGVRLSRKANVFGPGDPAPE